MSNIKSFNDLGDESASDDGEGFNDYYAGGKESGQLVRGAPKKQDEGEKDDKVSSLFDQARRAGAVQGTADDLKAPGGAFQGSARTLAGGSSQQASTGPLAYVITFYQNNIFTVNDGPARNIMDPANRKFLEAIERGECPEELEPPTRNQQITVNLVRKEEDYTEPEKPRVVAFQGTGRTLASGEGSSGAAAAPVAASAGEWAGVNEDLPTTSLQLRLADGSRMVARFNHTHHVSDIRRFIRAARPDITFAYSLMTGVPPAAIPEEADPTLEAAGLLNSVIIQKK